MRTRMMTVLQETINHESPIVLPCGTNNHCQQGF
jgi:hypothetical protein